VPLAVAAKPFAIGRPARENDYYVPLRFNGKIEILAVELGHSHSRTRIQRRGTT
jgi:hypothetical protein